MMVHLFFFIALCGYMLVDTKSMNEVNKLKILLSKEFNMKDSGAAKNILGMEIHRERALRRLWLS